MSVVMDGGYRQSAMGPPYEGHHGSSHCLSQPDPAAVELRAPATNYQSLTLQRPPQQRRSNGAPAANPRRQLVSSRVSDYLKSLNSMTRSIVLEKEYVEERHASEWRRMDEALQEEVVDDYFMPPDVHAHYGTLPRSHGRSYRSPASPTSEERFSFRNARVLVSRRNSNIHWHNNALAYDSKMPLHTHILLSTASSGVVCAQMCDNLSERSQKGRKVSSYCLDKQVSWQLIGLLRPLLHSVICYSLAVHCIPPPAVE